MEFQNLSKLIHFLGNKQFTSVAIWEMILSGEIWFFSSNSFFVPFLPLSRHILTEQVTANVTLAMTIL